MNVYDNVAFPLTINKYPAPAFAKEIYHLGEVKRLLSSMSFDELSGIISSSHAAKVKTKEKIESIAMRLCVSPEAAKKLITLLKENNPASADCKDIIGGWIEQLDEEISSGKAALKEKGILVNDDLFIVDGDGKIQTEIRKLTPYEIKLKVFETADKLNLTPYLSKLPKELSGGQMQRVALGRAIIKNVPVFLMDEPLSNLDAKLRLTMRSEIVKLHNGINATTIYVTHDQTEAMTMATRIVVMSRGFVQQIDTPENIYNNPVNIFVARFIGSPAMNVFEMTYDVRSGKLNIGEFNIALKCETVDKISAFYAKKLSEFENLLHNFDKNASELILKILSATGEKFGVNNESFKKGLIAKIKNVIKYFKEKKTSKDVEEFAEEKAVALKKLDDIKHFTDGECKLNIGIRPEKIKVEKYTEGKNYDTALVIQPTVCELLGREYNVYFNLFGQDTVAQIDAAERISVNDKIAVSFEKEDLYAFDPITGDRVF